MPHRTWPMTALLVFTGLNFILVSTITPVYDFVCFLPYWQRRRERCRQECEAALANKIKIVLRRCLRPISCTVYFLIDESYDIKKYEAQ